MATSGVTLDDELCKRFTDEFKMQKNRKFNYMVFDFSDDKKKIKIKEGGTDACGLLAALSDQKTSAKYFTYLHKHEGDPNEKIYLCLYSDDDLCGLKDKMLCASSFDALKRQLVGCNCVQEFHSVDDVKEFFHFD